MNDLFIPSFRYIQTEKVETPDIVIGIHPGLHAEGVYEFWEPTLELLLDKDIKTAFTVLSKEEYTQTLDRLDSLFVKYLYKGVNPFMSKHVKQTPHDANLMWSSNQYLVVFKVRIYCAIANTVPISIQLSFREGQWT